MFEIALLMAFSIIFGLAGAVAPLMIALGAKVINNSNMTSGQTSGLILREIRSRLPREMTND